MKDFEIRLVLGNRTALRIDGFGAAVVMIGTA